MYKYVNELMAFCKDHLKNYKIIEETEENVAVIDFDSKDDKFNVLIDYAGDNVDKVVVDKKEICFDESATTATKINTMFKEIMQRAKI